MATIASLKPNTLFSKRHHLKNNMYLKIKETKEGKYGKLYLALNTSTLKTEWFQGNEVVTNHGYLDNIKSTIKQVDSKK